MKKVTTPSDEELAQFIEMYQRRRQAKREKEHAARRTSDADNFLAERICTYTKYKNKRILRGKR